MNLFQGSECQKWNKPPIQPGQKKTPWQPNVKPQHVVQRGLGSRMECEATRKRISGIATGYLESQWFPVKEMMYTGFILSIFKWRHETAPAWPQGCDFVWKTMGFLRIFNIQVRLHDMKQDETTWNQDVFCTMVWIRHNLPWLSGLKTKTIGPSGWGSQQTQNLSVAKAQFGHIF